ncbi:hypothetical protein EIP91_007337 [Steccherinum ochraceum]|uniref:F-box domain-containing protein n=1 Tax=Steccherinum ochraceum TaxID=92696 RepID=A0A4R0RRQ4_9APHY|nr:hypothetical protein EIP91_007337 [Steccherinum ochraceum]
MHDQAEAKKILVKVARVIMTARHLENLQIHGLQDLLAVSLPFSTAIIAHRNLQTIEFDGVGTTTGPTLISKMRSSVRKAVLDFGCRRNSDFEGESDLEDSDLEEEENFDDEMQPSLFLLPFIDCLEELHLVNLPSCTMFAPYQPQYTKVHSLIIDTDFAEELGCDELAHTFPSLKFLTWRCADEPMHPDDDREMNLDALVLPDEIWTGLEVLTCDVWWAYLLVFRRPVRCWRSVRIGRRKDDVRQFHAALGDLQPKHLDMNDLQKSFRKLPLIFLSMRLLFDVRRKSCERLAATSLPIHTYLRSMDVENITQRWAPYLPELKYVSFQFCPDQLSDAVFAVTRPDNRITVKSLPEDAARKILDECPFADKLCMRSSVDETVW